MTQIPSVPSFKIIGREIKLGAKIGAGANGEVYEAWPQGKSKHFPFPAKFAVKVIRQDLRSPEFLQAVERENETARELQHPFIVQYIGSWVELQRGAHTGCYCLALHYCDGGDLHTLLTSYIRRREQMPSKLITLLMAHVFSALNYSHSKKVIHRDIKPANVFLVRSSVAKSDAIEAAMVGDYGLARPLEATVQMVATRVGTPCYCSPEIVAGEAYTVKTDIFSAGAMFYELMMQERAFYRPGYNDRQTFFDIINVDPVPRLVQRCAGRYDDGLVRVVSLCLTKHEKDRPSAYQVLTGICSTLNTYVLRHHIPVVEEARGMVELAALCGTPKRATAAAAVSPDKRSTEATPDPRHAVAPKQGGATPAGPAGQPSATVQRLMRRFREVVPRAYDADVLELLGADVELFLLLKVLATTRAGNAPWLHEGLHSLLDGMQPQATADEVVRLMTAPASPTRT